MAGKKEAQKKSETSSGKAKRDTSKSRQKSPARRDASKSPVKSKSPARSKSPGRKSPSRTKKGTSPSPARSPARRSPSRTAAIKGQEKVKTLLKISQDAELSDSDFLEPVQEVKEKPKVAVRGRSRHLELDRDRFKDVDDYVKEKIGMFRRSTRSSHSADMERVVHVTKYDMLSQKLAEFSDDDETLLKKSESEKATESKKFTELGGPIGNTLLFFAFPAVVYGLNVYCNTYQCTFKGYSNLDRFRRFSTYFNLKSFIAYAGYVVFLAVLNLLPFGGKKYTDIPNKQGKFEYVANGLFSAFVTLGLAFGLELYGLAFFNFITDHYFHFITTSVVVGFSLAALAYVRSFYVPVSALSLSSKVNNRMYNFFMGREISPRPFGRLDLKMFLFRSGVIGTILLTTSFLYKSLAWSATLSKWTLPYGIRLPSVDPTLAYVYGIIFIHLLISLIWEKDFVSSFWIQYEGCGYMTCLGSLLYPFVLSLPVKYLYEYGAALHIWKVALSLVLFVVGVIVNRLSNAQKDAFRKNPYAPALSHLESIPTTQGKKLLVSGLWGFVRHPNYLGDILVHLSIVPFIYNVPAVLASVVVILYLVHRAARDNAHCKQKYGAAWDRYCQKVKYVLVPKVY